MMGLSYWITVVDFNDHPTWEGMVYAHEESGQLKVHKEQGNESFFDFVRTSQHKEIRWEKMWKDVTNEYRLQSGSDASHDG